MRFPGRHRHYPTPLPAAEPSALIRWGALRVDISMASRAAEGGVGGADNTVPLREALGEIRSFSATAQASEFF